MCNAGASFFDGLLSFHDGNDATISDLTVGNNGTLFNGGEGYWDVDVYENAFLDPVLIL